MTRSDQSPLEPSLRSLLDRLRRRIRGYVWVEGVMAALAWLGVAFWLSLALDWWLEPPRAVRVAILAAVGLVLAWVLFRYIVRRAFVRIRDSSLAVLLERRYDHFHETLLTSVELAEQPQHAASFDPAMLDQTRRSALAQIGDVRVGQVFRMAPLMRKLSLAVLLVATVAGFGIFATRAFAVWIERNLQFADTPWPRKTALSIDGFADGSVKVARGSDLEIVVWADTSKEVVPDVVQVRYTMQEGETGRDNMNRVGVAVAPRDPFQKYTYTFKGILSPIVFNLYGGDDRIRDLKIEVVDSPTLSRIVLNCRYPAYMQREPRSQPVSGLMELPAGTEISVEGESNKDLSEVLIHRVRGENTERLQQIDMQGLQDRRKFTCSTGVLAEDQTLLFTLLDSDGIRSHDPIRLSLSATPDEPPKVNARLRSIGTAITPSARLPIEGDIADDYGLSKIWFEYQIDDAKPVAQPLALGLLPSKQPRSQLEFGRENEQALDVRDLKLVPGRKLAVTVKAADTYTLGKQPNVGSGESYHLDVVAPAQLLAILEARELMLRRQLEVVIEEMTETRDSLVPIDFSAADSPATDGVTGASPSPETKPADAKTSDSAGAATVPEKTEQPLEKASSGATPAQASAGRARELQLVSLSRALANSQRSAHETLAIATSFVEIHEEHLNNRIDVAELNTRLTDGIIVPLRRIAEERFPELETALQALETGVESGRTAPDQARLQAEQARRQADRILVEMNLVLQQMLKLEDYNQLVETLRELIDLQRQLNEKTAEKQKQKARSLLED